MCATEQSVKYIGVRIESVPPCKAKNMWRQIKNKEKGGGEVLPCDNNSGVIIIIINGQGHTRRGFQVIEVIKD